MKVYWPDHRAGRRCWLRSRLAETLSRGVVVTVLPDGGNRYLGDSFWHER